MVPEIRLLKKMAVAAAVIVPALAVSGTALGGARTGLSVMVGGLVAVGLLTITASGAALFGRAGDSAVPMSYAAGFFVKIGLLTAVMAGFARIDEISLTAVALSMGGVYLALLAVGAAFSGPGPVESEKVASQAAERS